MKILEIKIFNFGKFSNFNYKFNDKLHILDKPNGYGKTTIAEFINSMFFGMPSLQVKGTSNKRIKYSPWNGGKFGGSLVFSYLNQEYQVTREFGYNTSSDDTFELKNYKTNVSINKINNTTVDSRNFGETLFKINQVSFERTNFIPQSNVFFDNDQKIHGDINLRLREIFGDTRDDNNYKKAEKIIDEKLRMLHPKSKRGDAIYVKNEEKINVTDQLLNDAKEALLKIEVETTELEALKLKKEENEKQLLLLKKKIQTLNTYNETKLKKENYDKELERLEITNKSLKENKSFFINISPEDIKLTTYEKALENLNQEKTILEQFIDKKNDEINDLRESKSKMSTNQAEKTYYEREIDSKEREKLVKTSEVKTLNDQLIKLNPLNIILSIITLGIYLIIILLKNNKTNQEISSNLKRIEYLENEIFRMTLKLNELKKENGEDYDFLINEIQKEINLRNENYHKILNEVRKIYNDFKIDLNDLNVAYFKIENKYYEYFKLVKDLENINLELSKYNPDEFKNLKLDKALNFDSLNSEEKSLNLNNEELIRKINSLEKSILINEETASQLDFYKGELDILLEYRLNLDKKRKLLEETKDLLLKANQNLAIKYLEPLEDKVNELIKFFNLDDLIVSFDGNSNILVKTNDNASLYDLGYYSTGSQELMSVLVRLSLIDLIYKDLNPFIIFDDSFANFDDEKIKMVKPLLEKLSTKYQIIYFTCSSSRNLN